VGGRQGGTDTPSVVSDRDTGLTLLTESLKIQEVSHGARGVDSTICILFFIEVTKMIAAETNKYNYNPYLAIPGNDKRHPQLPNMTVHEMNVLLTITQMGC
jgi:hypothetical protein